MEWSAKQGDIMPGKDCAVRRNAHLRSPVRVQLLVCQKSKSPAAKATPNAHRRHFDRRRAAGKALQRARLCLDGGPAPAPPQASRRHARGAAKSTGPKPLAFGCRSHILVLEWSLPAQANSDRSTNRPWARSSRGGKPKGKRRLWWQALGPGPCSWAGGNTPATTRRQCITFRYANDGGGGGGGGIFLRRVRRLESEQIQRRLVMRAAAISTR